MRRPLLLGLDTVLLLALVACAGIQGGGQAAAPAPIKAVGSASGDSKGPQVFLLGQPVNALVKIHGDVQYTIQPFPPYVTLDGDYTVIVEPLPGKEAEAQRAVESGDLLIRRAGKASNLNAPGSVRAWKALRARIYAPAPPPPPTPAPAAKPSAIAPASCDPNDPTCQAPGLHTH